MDTPPVQYVTTSDGKRIAFCVSGEGVPLVLMPLIWNHIQLFWRTPLRRPFFEGLAARFRLIQFDARGQGMSARGLGEEHSTDGYARDLEAVINRLALNRFVLFAASMFCPVAVRYAIQYPDHVKALILVNPGFAPGSDFDQLMRENWDMFVETMARLSGNPEDPTSLVPLFRKCVNQSDFVSMSRAARDDLGVDLSGLSTPTLVVGRMGTPLVLDERPAGFAANISEARYVVFDDPSRGFYSLETPPAVFAIEDFVRSLPPEKKPAAAAAGFPIDALSPRQRQVLKLIARGKTNREIANELVLSERTVQRHVADLYLKIDARNRSEATAFALSKLSHRS